VSAWRLVGLCDHVGRTYGVSYRPWGLSRVLKRLGCSRQKSQPAHPKGNAVAQAAFKKQPPSKLRTIVAEHPDTRLQLWCQDEARFRQKGRTRAWRRPPAVVDQRYKSLYLFATCCTGTDESFALALPRANAGTMKVFLEHLAWQLALGVHAVLILD
jgi:Winged helix-turn helix